MKKNIRGILTCLVIIVALSGAFAQDFITESYIEGGISGFSSADFNADGKPDLVGFDYKFVGATDLNLLINTSDTTIQFETFTIASSEVFNGSPAIGDVDGDSDIDIAISLDNSNSIVLLKNNGDNTFTQEDPGLSGVNQLKFIDLEGDGDLDLVGYVFNDKIISNFINDGAGSFTEGFTFAHANDISFVDYGDIDGDGDQDLVLSVDKFSGETVAIYINNGDNQYSKLSSFDINALNSAVQVKMIDINRDGKMDVCGLNKSKLVAFLQNEVFGFVAQELVTPSNIGNLYRFVVEDFDGNGTLDFAIGDETEKSRWYSNQGLVFTQKELSGVRPIRSLLSADFDADGDIDMVANNGDFWAFRNEIEQMPSSLLELSSASFDIFPNPSGRMINIKLNNKSDWDLKIFDITGVLLHQERFNTSHQTVDISEFAEGTYHLQLVDRNTKRMAVSQIIKI